MRFSLLELLRDITRVPSAVIASRYVVFTDLCFCVEINDGDNDDDDEKLSEQLYNNRPSVNAAAPRRSLHDFISRN